MPPANVLQARDLNFAYGDQPVLQGWSCNIPPGLTYVVGDEGKGKTTLLKILAAQLAATSGSLSLRGHELANQAKAYRQEVFWVAPSSDAHDQLSVLDYFAALQADYPRLDSALCQTLAQEFGLEPHLHKKLFMLSTGSKRKVWLSAAFASGAALTLLDDPFAALDDPSRKLLREVLDDAAEHPQRAFVVSGYAVPMGIEPAMLIDLDKT